MSAPQRRCRRVDGPAAVALPVHRTPQRARPGRRRGRRSCPPPRPRRPPPSSRRSTVSSRSQELQRVAGRRIWLRRQRNSVIAPARADTAPVRATAARRCDHRVDVAQVRAARATRAARPPHPASASTACAMPNRSSVRAAGAAARGRTGCSPRTKASVERRSAGTVDERAQRGDQLVVEVADGRPAARPSARPAAPVGRDGLPRRTAVGRRQRAARRRPDQVGLVEHRPASGAVGRQRAPRSSGLTTSAIDHARRRRRTRLGSHATRPASAPAPRATVLAAPRRAARRSQRGSWHARTARLSRCKAADNRAVSANRVSSVGERLCEPSPHWPGVMSASPRTPPDIVGIRRAPPRSGDCGP